MTTTTTNPSPALPLVQGTWALDHNHTSVGFTIRRLGLAKVRGHFTDVAAELVVGSTVEESSVTATIALASVDTGNADRDAHLRSADLLDVAARPTMTFRSTGVRRAGSDPASGSAFGSEFDAESEWVVDGELTIGEITAPVTLDVRFDGVADFFDGTRHAAFEATGEIRRKDFGLGFGMLGAGLGDVVRIELDLEFVEPAAAT